jgi:hypothetical protein
MQNGWVSRSVALLATAAALTLAAGGISVAQELKIALIAGKTGPLEAYAKQTETGFMMGLEYLTKGTMRWEGKKLVVIVKDDQIKPDLARSLLEQAYADEKVDIAVGTTSSAAALAMLPIAQDYKKVLLVEPAVADAITGDKWNRYIFRTGRNSTQDAYAAAASFPKTGEVSVATLAQDYAFGRDGIAALRPRSPRSAERESGLGGIRAADHDRLHGLRAAVVRRAQGQAGPQGDPDHLGRAASAAQDRRARPEAPGHRAGAGREHSSGDAAL